ncbi:hypothetical protein PoB_003945700 [Plakobranchus ocellatus]|uniref:Uncharacterized protein n=1 Tax=Plakobranchus ocellatus TaxID=259542 RepID=A0AAV4B0B4_9GAST|nr:hypothetical protein PoB_003945700 [Plakobranchus ocellatus]
MLSGLLSGRGASGGARTRDRRVPGDLRADSLATVPPTPHKSGKNTYLPYEGVQPMKAGFAHTIDLWKTGS